MAVCARPLVIPPSLITPPDLGDDRRVRGAAGFEQLDHGGRPPVRPWIVGARGIWPAQSPAVDLFSVAQQKWVGRHQVALFVVLGPFTGRTIMVGTRFSFRRTTTTQCEIPRFRHLLLQGHAAMRAFEVDHAADFGEIRERVRIPLSAEQLVAFTGARTSTQTISAVENRSSALIAPLFVHRIAKAAVRVIAISCLALAHGW